jgi:hypothetical protein
MPMLPRKTAEGKQSFRSNNLPGTWPAMAVFGERCEVSANVAGRGSCGLASPWRLVNDRDWSPLTAFLGLVESCHSLANEVRSFVITIIVRVRISFRHSLALVSFVSLTRKENTHGVRFPLYINTFCDFSGSGRNSRMVIHFL